MRVKEALIVGVMMTLCNSADHVEAERVELATFAGGCFWCMEHPFDRLDGVLNTVVGYTGGSSEQPDYAAVSSGATGHAEAVQITFDAERISYEALLHVFWKQIDPTTPNRQFCDVGSQYRSAIFYHDDKQKVLAELSKKHIIEQLQHKVVTEIVSASHFWPAESYHQDYYRKNPIRYKFYRYSCGRDQRLEVLWGKR